MINEERKKVGVICRSRHSQSQTDRYGCVSAIIIITSHGLALAELVWCAGAGAGAGAIWLRPDMQGTIWWPEKCAPFRAFPSFSWSWHHYHYH